MSAEEFKTKGNAAVAEKKWAAAENFYTSGINNLNSWEKDLHVLLLSNRSFARLHMGKHNEALQDAEKAIDLDHFYEKAYIRKTAALEALRFKRAVNNEDTSCPVLTCFREGLAAVPNSTLLKDAMKLSFPWLKDRSPMRQSGQSASTGSNAKRKKQSAPTKAQRESCEPVDIRGASGPHELRINGVYTPTEEVSGGWPLYRKRTDDDGYDDEDDLDEDDNTILEFQSGLNEWMIKHASSKGTHRSFIHCKSSALSKPEDCLSVWQGIEDKKAIPQPTLTVLTERDRAESDQKHFSLVRASCRPVEVRGATGRKAVGINGRYEPTEVNHGGWPVYRKMIPPAKSVSDTASIDVPTSAVSTSSPTSANVSSKKIPPPSISPVPNTDTDIDTSSATTTATTVVTTTVNTTLSVSESENISSIAFMENDARVWLEYNPYFKSWQIKPTVCLRSNRSWAYIVCQDHIGRRPELCVGTWDVLDDSDFRSQENINMMPVDLWAADDLKSKECWSHAEVLNIRGATGAYASLINGIFEPSPTFDGGYRKKSDSSCVIEYNRKKLRWQMRTHSAPFAIVSDPARVTPDQCAAPWSVIISGNFEVNNNISVMTVEKRKQLDIEKYGDKLSQAVALDIRGAIGMNAFKVNGVYEPTHEIAGGWPVYQRKGSFDYWLEFNSERENWQIKSAANRGMDSAFAYVDASPPCSPDRCEGPWWVYTGSKTSESSNGWEVQRSVTVMLVEKRHEDDMKLFVVRQPTCVPVDIRGAGGPRSNGLNGVFIPTSEMHGGWPVYRKRDDSDWWLEYDACPQKWMVRPSPCRGTTRGRAYILSDPSLRPEQVKGLWRMSDGKGGWAIEPSIYVRPESVAIEEDRIQFEARRATAVSIDLRGVGRPMSYINGVYEPTNESCCGWPVYKKQSSDNQWLEYHLPSREWQIKPTSCKGSKKNWAYVSSDPTHPELCTDAFWMILVSGKHMKQEGVTLVSLEQRAREDKVMAEQRRASCVPIIISGATGKSGEVINGLYEPSSAKTCGGWPSYFRQGSESRSLLEFNIYAMSWTITAIVFKKQAVESSATETEEEKSTEPTVTTGKLIISSPPSLVAFVEVAKLQRPEQARENPWKVLGPEKFEPQDSVIVMVRRGGFEELAPQLSDLALMPAPRVFDADADVEEVDTITSPTATSTAIAKTKKKKVKAVEQGIVSVASTSISASVKQTGPVLAVKDAVIAPVIATSTPPVLKGWIEVGGNKKTKAPKSATPVASIGPPLTQTTVSSNSSNPQTAPSQPVKVIRTINNQINNDFPKIPAVPKQTVAAQSPDATKSGSSATDPSSAPIAWSDNGRKTKTKVSVSGTAVTAKVASTDNSVVMPQSTSKGPLSAPKSYKEVISKQKADDKNTETLVPAIFTVNTKGSHTHLKDTTAPDSPLIDSESYDEEGLSMESMMQEFQALGSQSLESPFGYGLGQKSEPRYEDDDDLFEAIRSASIVTGLDLEHPFPLSEQYFDSFPTLSHQNSSLADFTDEFSDDFFNGVGLSKGPSLGLSQASLNDHSSSMLLSHSDAELASGFAGLAHFHQPNSMGASLTNMQSGLYSTGQLHALSHSYAHSPQYSEFLGGTPQALTSPSFQAHGPMQSKPGFTDKLSTTSTTTSNSVEYLSESYLQGQVSSSALSLGLNPILGLDLGTDSVHRVVEDTEGDPNPALIKESDLLISDEYARLDREKAFGESLFPATLWGRSVFVRKLNNNTTQGIIEPHPGDGEKLRLDFLRELQVLTDFRHQNILPLQAFSFWPMILVYPLLHDRLTLLELMSDGALMGSLHWSTRLRVISTLCNALTYVHHGCPELARPGIVHRNIHPGNILVSVEDGDTLLCDFRQSRDLNYRLSAVSGSSGSMCADLRVDENWIVGAPAYVDPQYLQSRLYFPHSDVYSVGVILMQLLLSLSPSDGEQLDISIQIFLFHCKPLMNNSTSLHLNGMNEVLAHLERMRGSGSPPWPPLAMLQTARAVVTCLTPYDLSERERGLGLTAEALQLLLLEVTNSNIGVSNGGTTI